MLTPLAPMSAESNMPLHSSTRDVRPSGAGIRARASVGVAQGGYALLVRGMRLTAGLWLLAGVALGDPADLQTGSAVEAKAADTAVDAQSQVRRSNHFIADLKLQLVWIEPGAFMMGSSPEMRKDKAESPPTQVRLTRGFWLGRTEVTQAQYTAVMETNPSTFKQVGPDAPVERVSWIDAMKFCETLTQRERTAGRLPDGFEFTLPTEAQWEYACRAGTTAEYAGDPEAMAWYDGNSGGSTHPVATKKPNAWGLYDMSGNVLEWCYDWYGDYSGGSVVDPTGPRHGHYRMARGGSWRAEMHVGRSPARAGGSAGRLDYTMGFRVALVPIR